MIRSINFFLIIAAIVLACYLVTSRYVYRVYSNRLANLQTQAVSIMHEYSRLQIEDATYSSNIILAKLAAKQLHLVQADKLHVVGLDHVSKK
jgi:cell division protein FtsL